jgi:hypothetical protein
MRKHVSPLVMSGALVGLAACGDGLQITNFNNPDVARAYATPAGVEGVIAGLGVQVFNTQRATESVNTQAKILAGETFASVANFGMAARAQIPRSIISNELGNDNQTGNLANFNQFSRVARTAANAIQAVNRLGTSGQTIGSPAQDARAKAFAFYVLGQALGNLSLAYDSAAIVTPAVPTDEVPRLSAAAAVNAAALQMLDSAIAVANSAAATTGSNGFPLPTTWLNGNSVTRDQFVSLARSYKARFRAGVARTTAQRGAVNWQEVIADANAGVRSDFTVNVGGGSGWSAAFDLTQIYVVGGWHQLSPLYYGMADVSGGYDQWLATPRDSRKAFVVITPDRRWPAGATRAAQQAAAPTQVLPPGVYIRNRPSGDDVPLGGYGDSHYDHRRYGAANLAASTGPYVEISATEMSMLAAEGYIRTNQLPLAIPLINASRARNGLDALPASLASATAPYSADKSTCVPQVPAAPAFTSAVCGSVLEAMKYEKRMETAFTGYMIWFADNRGWGDLVEGTAVEWPVPYQEMQARQQAYYNGTNRAPKGTYGF